MRLRSRNHFVSFFPCPFRRRLLYLQRSWSMMSDSEWENGNPRRCGTHLCVVEKRRELRWPRRTKLSNRPNPSLDDQNPPVHISKIPQENNYRREGLYWLPHIGEFSASWRGYLAVQLRILVVLTIYSWPSYIHCTCLISAPVRSRCFSATVGYYVKQASTRATTFIRHGSDTGVAYNNYTVNRPRRELWTCLLRVYCVFTATVASRPLSVRRDTWIRLA